MHNNRLNDLFLSSLTADLQSNIEGSSTLVQQLQKSKSEKLEKPNFV